MLSSLVESERAFSRAAAELGIRDAFLANLAEDGILFRPRAVNAQEWLSAQPATPGLLSWEPAYADIAEAGDMGYTTGPWEYRADPEGDPLAHGQYFTIWQKQPDGTWKAVIDHGTEYAPRSEPPGEIRTPARRDEDRWLHPDVDVAAELEALLQTDRAFAGASEAKGMFDALRGYVTSDVRVLRNGMQPQTGVEAMRAIISERLGALTWKVVGGAVSRSGDIGYTYGEYEFTADGSTSPDETGNYVRAWTHLAHGGGTWRVAVDVMIPIP
jgi:ketosteroid isomerase-like protein